MNYFITITDKGPTGVYVSRDLAERVKETRLGEVRHEVVECVTVDDISTGTCSRCGNTDTPVQRFCRGCMETSDWLSPDEAKRLEAALRLAAPILSEVSKACCDILDWNQIDGDEVNAALKACTKALKGQP